MNNSICYHKQREREQQREKRRVETNDVKQARRIPRGGVKRNKKEGEFGHRGSYKK